jgi:YD repeat-containing protein
MPTRLKHALYISTAVIPLLFAPLSVSYAETVNYEYDDLNRLVRVEYGDGTIIRYTYDRFGNRTEETFTKIEGSIAINSGAEATNKRNVALSLTCSVASGCSKMKFSNDGSTYTTAEKYAPSKAWTLTAGDGKKTVWARFSDRAGIWSSEFSDKILLDKTAPTATASPAAGSYGSPQSVTLACNDGIGSGCEKIYYTTDGSTPTTASPVYSSPILVSVTTTLKFFATDLVGNSAAVKTKTYTIFEGSMVINSGAETTNSRTVTLTLTCGPAGACSKMRFSNNGTTYTTAENYAPTKAWTLTAGNGKKTVWAQFKNAAGIWSPEFSDTILLDMTAPAATASPAEAR